MAIAKPQAQIIGPLPSLSESIASLVLPYQCQYIPCEVVYFLSNTSLQRNLLLNTDIAPGCQNIQYKIFMITASLSCFAACNTYNKMRTSADDSESKLNNVFFLHTSHVTSAVCALVLSVIISDDLALPMTNECDLYLLEDFLYKSRRKMQYVQICCCLLAQ